MTPEAGLELLIADASWTPDWGDVLRRAEASPSAPATKRMSMSRTRRRRLALVAVAILIAVAIPLTALAVDHDWWFLSSGSPAPTHPVVTIKQGVWDGKPWQLVGYPSATDGLCFSLTPTRANGDGLGAALNCAPFLGIPRTNDTKRTGDLAITYLTGSATAEFPAYVVGPVIPDATKVSIRLADGTTVTTPTFTAPAPLNNVRFYATPLHADSDVQWVAGIDINDEVVACLAPASRHSESSPLGGCR